MTVVTAGMMLPPSAHGQVTFTNLAFLDGPNTAARADEVLNSSAFDGTVLGATPIGVDAIAINGTKRLGSNPYMSTPADSYDFFMSSTSFINVPGSATVNGAPTSRFSNVMAINPGTNESRINSSNQFLSSFSASYSSTPNNPGTAIGNVLRVEFGPHLVVTDLILEFTSLNTGSGNNVTWEYSVIRLLDTSGNYFSSLSPSIGFTPGATGQFLLADAANPQDPASWPAGGRGGFNGNAGVGNYVAANTSPIRATTVGTATVNSSSSGGPSGHNDNINLTYALFGLAAGTPIGGFEWMVVNEDVRGSSNGTSSFNANLQRFVISGTYIPEPGFVSVVALGLLAFAGIWLRARRLRKV